MVASSKCALASGRGRARHVRGRERLPGVLGRRAAGGRGRSGAAALGVWALRAMRLAGAVRLVTVVRLAGSTGAVVLGMVPIVRVAVVHRGDAFQGGAKGLPAGDEIVEVRRHLALGMPLVLAHCVLVADEAENARAEDNAGRDFQDDRRHACEP